MPFPRPSLRQALTPGAIVGAGGVILGAALMILPPFMLGRSDAGAIWLLPWSMLLAPSSSSALIGWAATPCTESSVRMFVALLRGTFRNLMFAGAIFAGGAVTAVLF